MDLRDLEGEKFILLDINKGIRKVQDRTIKSYGINPEVVFTTKNFETAKRLAANGMGITIIPKDYLNIFSQDKSYDSFNLSGTEENIWYTAILTIPDIYKSQATKVFIDEVKRFFK